MAAAEAAAAAARPAADGGCESGRVRTSGWLSKVHGGAPPAGAASAARGTGGTVLTGRNGDGCHAATAPADAAPAADGPCLGNKVVAVVVAVAMGTDKIYQRTPRVSKNGNELTEEEESVV